MCQIYVALPDGKLSLSCLDNPPNPHIRFYKIPFSNGRPYNTICSTEYYWRQDVTFKWILGEEELPGITLPARRHFRRKTWDDYYNNTATYLSKLDHTFNRCDNSRNISCIVQVRNEVHGNVPYRASTVVDVDCK